MLLKYFFNCNLFGKNVYKTSIVVVFSVFLASGCDNRNNLKQMEPLCALDENIVRAKNNNVDANENCTYVSGFGELELRSSHPLMPVEESISLYLRTPSETLVIASEITGLSMYMGRIPIVWESIGPDLWQTEILLGACTDPNMVWQLEITIASANDLTAEEQLEIEFQSTW